MPATTISKVITQVSNQVSKMVAEVTGKGNTENDPDARDQLFGFSRKALSFDLYGCLLNYRPIEHFVGQVGRENNISPELSEHFFNLYLNRIMYSGNFMNYRDILDACMHYLDMELNTKVFTANATELYLLHNDLKLNPDVLPVLHALKDKGYELYLLANTSMFLMKPLFERLDNLFGEKTVLVSDEVRCYKPNIDFFKAASDKFKLRSAEHFHVSSDYFRDIMPATRLRWLTAYVNRSKTGVYENMEPSVIITSLADLEEGMNLAKQRIEAEERAAREREEQAAAAEAAAAAKAEEERKQRKAAEEAARMKAYQQQQLQQQQHMFSRHTGVIVDDMASFGGGTHQYFVPETQEDMILAEKMKKMSPARARAVAKARERALKHRF